MIRNGGQLFLPENSTENGGKPQIRYYDNEQFANLALDEKTGASIDLSIDTSTYVMTVALKNADGTIISSGNIDFPLESVVVNATYKNGILTLVLQNGNSVNVDISDIISGLVAEDGDGSNLTASFTESATRTNITTGEKLSVLFGKIKKWFTDLKSLAFKSKTEAGDYTAGSITSTDTDSTIAKTSDLSGYLPLSAGSGKPLTGTIYTPGTVIKNSTYAYSDTPTSASATNLHFLDKNNTYISRIENVIGSSYNQLVFRLKNKSGTAVQLEYVCYADDTNADFNFDAVTDNKVNLGQKKRRFKNLYLSGFIGNGTYTYNLPSKSGNLALLSDCHSKNLLINPDFSINQRGKTEYATNNTYTVDRWRLAYGRLAVNTDGTVSHTTSNTWQGIVQYIENPSRLSGKNVTFSAMGFSDGGQINITIKVLFSGDSSSTQIASKTISTASKTIVTVTATLPTMADNDKLFVLLNQPAANKTTTWYWAKLEIGSVATPFVPPLIAEELPKCQRYGFMLASGPVRYPSTQIDASIIDFTIPTPVSLRTPPTLSNTANIVVYNPDNAMAVQTGFTFSVVHTTSNAICIRATKSAHGLSRAVLGFTANIFLDAEIY